MRIYKFTRTLSIAALSLAGLAVSACGQGDATADGVEVPGTVVTELSELFTGDFELIDQDGAPYSNSKLLGKTGVIYFGFATCPDVCPMALGTLNAGLTGLTAEERAKIQPVFVTVDPERDGPEVVKAYVAPFDDFVGLTGSVEAVAAAKRSFMVYAEKEPLPDSALGYTMNHTSLFYIVDSDGMPKYAVHDAITPDQLTEFLRRNIK